ncbi:MAG: hypothetical protein VX656_12690 [Candidatus Latescibacterota bacterium]|nr:hypothetical protein [Candidatus Latescibacterota bacterium]
MDGVGADDRLEILEVRLDRPTLHNLGVQVLIDGDDDRDAHVSLRYRQQGEVDWQPGPPLLRAWPETVRIDVLQQFSGSVSDLEPAPHTRSNSKHTIQMAGESDLWLPPRLGLFPDQNRRSPISSK